MSWDAVGNRPAYLEGNNPQEGERRRRREISAGQDAPGKRDKEISFIK